MQQKIFHHEVKNKKIQASKYIYDIYFKFNHHQNKALQFLHLIINANLLDCL